MSEKISPPKLSKKDIIPLLGYTFVNLMGFIGGPAMIIKGVNNFNEAKANGAPLFPALALAALGALDVIAVTAIDFIVARVIKSGKIHT